jgi:hypothetical protein
MSEKTPMNTYSTFTLPQIRKHFALTIQLQNCFPDVDSVAPSEFLQAALKRARSLALSSEKARSEFLVAPILLDVREYLHNDISIYSGIRFDVSAEEGLQGICDFIISKSPPLPTLQAPLLMLVEAKKNDLDEGFGQCAGEMIAAQRFNQADDLPDTRIYGCVTTGELWQFLCLDDKVLSIDPRRVYIEQVDKILGSLVKMLA